MTGTPDFTLILEREEGVHRVPIVLDFTDFTAEENALVYGFRVAHPELAEDDPELAAFMVFLKACRGREWLVPDWPAVHPVLLSLMQGSDEYLIVEEE